MRRVWYGNCNLNRSIWDSKRWQATRCISVKLNISWRPFCRVVIDRGPKLCHEETQVNRATRATVVWTFHSDIIGTEAEFNTPRAKSCFRYTLSEFILQTAFCNRLSREASLEPTEETYLEVRGFHQPIFACSRTSWGSIWIPCPVTYATVRLCTQIHPQIALPQKVMSAMDN